MDQSDGRAGFAEWLAATHPDVRLTTMQQEWVDATERGERPMWIASVGTGKTFIFNLWREYQASGETPSRGQGAQ